MNKKIVTGLLALAGVSLALTGCASGNAEVTNPDGSAFGTATNVIVVPLNDSEKVVCIKTGGDAISCDWDNKITSP